MSRTPSIPGAPAMSVASALALEAVALPGTPARAAGSLRQARFTLDHYFFLHAMGLLFPLTVGLALFGVRAAVAVALVLSLAVLTTFAWKRVGERGGQLDYAQVLWLALLLALMLPADAAIGWSLKPGSPWTLLALAAVLLGIFYWLLGGIGLGRIHPTVVAYLVIAVLYGPQLVPHHVLQRDHLGLGNLMAASNNPPPGVMQEPWLRRPIRTGFDAVTLTPASSILQAYTTGQVSPDRSWLSLEGLLRDRLPPLEDLIVGAHPGPIGAGSGIAVIIGGLLLIYRQVVDYRIPLLIVLTAFVMFLVLPVPAVITDRPQWRWIVGQDPDLGWAMGVTLADYELLASPLLFTAFFLATAPAVRPMTRRGRAVYAVVVGALAGAFQLYVSVSYGSYLALLMASLLTPTLDRWIRPRPLV